MLLLLLFSLGHSKKANIQGHIKTSKHNGWDQLQAGNSSVSQLLAKVLIRKPHLLVTL